MRLIQDVKDVLSRPDGEGRGLDGDQNDVAGGNGGFGQLVPSRRPVNDDPVIMLPEGRNLPMQRGFRQSNDGELAVCRALRFPVEGRSLWIGIDQQHRAMVGQRGSGMNGKRGFANTALLIQKREDGHGAPPCLGLRAALSIYLYIHLLN